MLSSNNTYDLKIWKTDLGILYFGKEILFFFKPQKIEIYKDIFIYNFDNKKIIKMHYREINNLKKLEKLTFEDEDWCDKWVWDYYCTDQFRNFQITGFDLFFIKFDKPLIYSIRSVVLLKHDLHIEASCSAKDVLLLTKLLSNYISLTKNFKFNQDYGIQDDLDLYFFLKKTNKIKIKFNEKEFFSILHVCFEAVLK